ncbi:MAG: response regulator transcription factor [Gammaproteobacteria bacterium]|nr:response regulator transcription factor [Gammaproteobacteria bacterium]MDH3448242.1 response regulator transcription factor [Gammaproteobacteria bacterium]
MKLVIYSASRPFEQFLGKHLTSAFEFRSRLQAPSNDPEQLYLLHISSMELDCYEWLLRHVSGKPIRVGVCSDLPNIREMLECVRLGAKGYCNSYMAEQHYQQMLQLLANDQSWFPPHMLEETFRLAQQANKPDPAQKPLQMLTPREKEIALAVAEGKSNRQIADLYDISEPTVKTHLTSIFRKLDLKDRVGLVLYLKQT